MDVLDGLLARARRQEERRGRVREAERRWAALDSHAAPEALLDAMAHWIREQTAMMGRVGCILGVSGGVDSTLVAIAVHRAVGARGLGLIMPDAASDPRDEADARRLCDLLHLPYRILPLAGGLDGLLAAMDTGRDEAPLRHVGNMASRVRVAALYYQACINNYLVVGSGDIDETYIGYSSKGLAADLYPITGLHKDEVRALAYAALAPLDPDFACYMADRPASPGFWVGQRAEDQIGLSYTRVGRVLDVLIPHCAIQDAAIFPRDVDAFLEDLARSEVPSQDVLAVVDLMFENYDTAFGSAALYRPPGMMGQHLAEACYNTHTTAREAHHGD